MYAGQADLCQSGRPQLWYNSARREHNLPKADERRAHALSRANRAVDAGAGRSAEGGRDEELTYLQTHAPETSTPLAFYTHGGAPVTGDVRVRTQQAVGLRTAARAAARRGDGTAAKVGEALRMATRGEAHARATAMAFNGASAAVQMAMLQGRLCRMRSSVRELLRRPQSAELRQLKRVLAPGGKAEERCVCGSYKKETRAHWETSCPMAAGQVAAVDAAMSEHVVWPRRLPPAHTGHIVDSPAPVGAPRHAHCALM